MGYCDWNLTCGPCKFRDGVVDVGLLYREKEVAIQNAEGPQNNLATFRWYVYPFLLES